MGDLVPAVQIGLGGLSFAGLVAFGGRMYVVLERVRRQSEERERRCEQRLNLHVQRASILRQVVSASGISIPPRYRHELDRIDQVENDLLGVVVDYPIGRGGNL